MNQTTTRHARRRRASAHLMIGAMLVQTVAPAFATVSQLPGLYITPPPANVMFTLDDSLSMLSDAIPDFIADQVGMPNADGNSQPSDALTGVAGQQRARFPGMWKANTLYWGVTYYRSNNAIARYMRSSAGNPLYYNPKVTYKPWPLATDDKSANANANPAAVNIDPSNPFTNTFTRDLTTRVNETGTAADADDEAKNFWPATYYVYTGTTPLPNANPNTALNLATSFTKYVVTGLATDTSTFPRDAARTDCTGAVGATGCSRVQELQNFANWLQYYRSRMLMAKGGVAAAFAQQQTDLRIGFGSINSAGTVRQGVAAFGAARRTTFYTDLYAIPPSGGGTQLRRAMDEVGVYFQRSNVGNPWAEDPTSNALGKEYTCRKSFHILSTDGYWNGAAAGGVRNSDNQDNYSGNTPAKPSGQTYAYGDAIAAGADPLTGRFTVNPFEDNRTGTLADVAAYYWKNDLRGTLANEVPSSLKDPAFWQHLSTYTVGLGVSGSGTVKVDGMTTVPATTPSTSPLFPFIGRPWLESQTVRDYLIDNKIAVDWPSISADQAVTGDDLVHAAMNGRGKYYSASDPTTLANGLASALAEAGDNPGSMANIATESPQVASDTEVYQATYNPARWSGRLYAFTQSGTGSVNTNPSSAVWEASNKMPAPDDRNIFTWNPTASAGRTFTWSQLTSTQQTALNGSSDVLDFLRGSDAKELLNGGTFRDRARYTVGSVKGGVLGDIVNGSPIKGPSAGGGYNRLPAGVPGQATYATYRSAANTGLDNMRDTLFTAANDGMLHAFNRHTGVERFAYVPNSVYSVPVSSTVAENRLAMLTSPAYAHRFTVDGPPQIADAFINGDAAAATWRTVLLGSTGAGARSVFAMDISNPVVGTTGFGTSKLMWEFSQADNSDMGFVLNYPHVARMKDGTWVAIFGNGYDSFNGQAKLFILNLQTGKVLWEQAVGAANSGNGLSQPNFTVNNQREVTAIYAGDLKGNLWKFDVDNADPTKWKVAFGTAAPYTPLYASTAGANQPITVMPEITYHPNGGVLVSYGTGKLFEVEDTSTSASVNVNLNTQRIFGIWDKPGETTGFSADSLLVQQAFNTTLAAAANTDLSGTTSNTVDWGSKRGWYFNLGTGGERVNVSPQQAESTLLVVANKPDSDPCKTGGSSRLFAFDPITGGAPIYGVFDADNSGKINNIDRGYNVRAISFAVLSLPTLQTKKPVGDPVVPEAVGSRGQTGVRLGGVEDKVRSAQDCAKWLLAGGSDTSIAGFDISLCNNNKPRISWRQLQ
jgi:type IV pilus assembly protein PilY1